MSWFTRHGFGDLLRRGAPWAAAVGAALVAGAMLPAPPARAQVIIYSQNLLRFGHGKRTATQCSSVGALIPNADIILIQELMKPATPCTQSVLPGTYAWAALGPYGRGSYYEYYGFIYSTTPRSGGPKVAVWPKSQQGAGSGYIRPPQALLFQVTSGSSSPKYVWVGNAHLLWGGSSPGPRRAEASALATFFTKLQTLQNTQTGQPYSTNVVIGGDWNLPATDPGFVNLVKAGAAIQPNVQTSLNRAGGLSQPYDHFVVSKTVALTGVTTVPSTGIPAWRTGVSDHLGVVAAVTLK